MESQDPPLGLVVPDPKEAMTVRDRALALRYVRLGEARSAVHAIVAESGVERRTVYRAIKRQLDWARAEAARTQSGPEVL